MTAKEQAIEFVEKYKLLCGGYWGGKINKEFAKQSALIAVNQIILSNPHSNPFNTDVYSTIDYWIEVKKEIENL